MVLKKKVLRVFQRDLWYKKGGPKFWNKKIGKFFFEKPSHGCLSPLFDGERGGIWGANGGGGGIYATLPTK